jgi:hypothetical protein
MVKTISKMIGGETCSQTYENMIKKLLEKQIDIITFPEKINAKLLTSDTPLNWLILKNIIDIYNKILNGFKETEGASAILCKNPFIEFLQTLSGNTELRKYLKNEGGNTYFIKIISNTQTFTLSWEIFGMGLGSALYTDFINKLQDSIFAIYKALSYQNPNIMISLPTDLDLKDIKFNLLETEIAKQINKISDKAKLPNFDIDAENVTNQLTFNEFINKPENHLESLLVFLFQIEKLSLNLAIKNKDVIEVIRNKNISDTNIELKEVKFENFKKMFTKEKESLTTPTPVVGGFKSTSPPPKIVDKYVYKNKKYKIRFGPKGGKYILVDGEPIRI